MLSSEQASLQAHRPFLEGPHLLIGVARRASLQTQENIPSPWRWKRGWEGRRLPEPWSHCLQKQHGQQWGGLMAGATCFAGPRMATEAGGVLPRSPSRPGPPPDQVLLQTRSLRKLPCQDHSRSALEPGLERAPLSTGSVHAHIHQLGCTPVRAEGPVGLVSCPVRAEHRVVFPWLREGARAVVRSWRSGPVTALSPENYPATNCRVNFKCTVSFNLCSHRSGPRNL